MSATILGDTTPVNNVTRKLWTYPDGEVQEQITEGERAAVATLYDAYKAVSGYMPTLDSLQYDPEEGFARMTARLVADGEPMYEMFANDVYRPIYLNSYFATGGAGALTDAQILAVRNAFEEGAEVTTPAAAVLLWQLLNRGVEEYYETQYVLRETKNVSKRSAVTASYTNVNRVDTPPSYSTANTLIGSVPSGEWLKKPPVVRMLGKRRWQIVTEWWWAEKWSAILYGGTGSP